MCLHYKKQIRANFDKSFLKVWVFELTVHLPLNKNHIYPYIHLLLNVSCYWVLFVCIHSDIAVACTPYFLAFFNNFCIRWSRHTVLCACFVFARLIKPYRTTLLHFSVKFSFDSRAVSFVILFTLFLFCVSFLGKTYLSLSPAGWKQKSCAKPLRKYKRFCRTNLRVTYNWNGSLLRLWDQNHDHITLAYLINSLIWRAWTRLVTNAHIIP